ncbi:hypothetical protein UlMin_010469 [Ulmus minor]
MLPKKVRYAITRLFFFINALCSKAVDVNNLDNIQQELVTTLCMLEMYFLPTFFDVMIHLTVHLVREVKLCGPVLKEKNWSMMYGLVNPNDFSYGCGNSNQQAKRLCDRLLQANEDQIFFAPYNSDTHWMLVALDPYNNNAYYMDSMAKKGLSNVRDVPRQLGGHECGFYVMRFMKDIIENHTLLTSEKVMT